MNPEKYQVFHRYFSVLGDLFSPFFFAVVYMAPCFAEIRGNDQKPSIFLDWEQVRIYKLLQEVNSNVKMLFRHEGESLGIQYKMGEQRKTINFSLACWCLLSFPTAAGEPQVTPGVH